MSDDLRKRAEIANAAVLAVVASAFEPWSVLWAVHLSLAVWHAGRIVGGDVKRRVCPPEWQGE